MNRVKAGFPDEKFVRCRVWPDMIGFGYCKNWIVTRENGRIKYLGSYLIGSPAQESGIRFGNSDGFSRYETDSYTGHDDRDRHWRVQAGGMVGLLNAYGNSGPPRMPRGN